MIRPAPLALEEPHGPWSCRGCDIWDTMSAACDGDVAALQTLLERDPNLYRAEYWYTQQFTSPFARDMVVWLLAHGAPVELADDEPWATPLAWARRRGHEEIAGRLEAGAQPT